MELEKIQILAQLISGIENSLLITETSYEKNNSEEFADAKKTIMEFQRKISEIMK